MPYLRRGALYGNGYACRASRTSSRPNMIGTLLVAPSRMRSKHRPTRNMRAVADEERHLLEEMRETVRQYETLVARSANS